MYLDPLLAIVFAVEESVEAAEPGGVGMGGIVLTVTVAALLVWFGYLFVNSRRSRKDAPESAAPNQTPYMSDDEMENTRTTNVLRAALFAAAVLAILAPWYAFNEPDRQAEAAETIAEEDIEAGEHWYDSFGCIGCHGPDGGGGSAAFTEPRSGVAAPWTVPSLNDVLFRFDLDELRRIIVFGRAGTPMPANGLEGGGAMTVQEVDQVIDYIDSFQLSQSEVLAKADGAVDLALARISNGDETVQGFIALQEAKIVEVKAAPAQLEATATLADEVLELFGSSGTCTEGSAELALTTCDDPADDTDRDGLSDAVEPELTAIAETARSQHTVLNETTLEFDEKGVYAVAFDPASDHTNRTADGTPIPDLDAAEEMLGELQADAVVTKVTADQQDQFLGDLEAGLAFLEESADLQLWDVDLDALTGAMSEAAGRAITPDEAERAVGLFNANCARCHTGGYSSGSPFEIGAGHGAWGPAIYDGRTLIQFPAIESHVDFVVKGSQVGTEYGVNGVGNGEMPGFGASLTAEDIELIVLYERTL